jgi:L-ascorbate metabolism protein UlaG (beta-lactamase superfamily)
MNLLQRVYLRPDVIVEPLINQWYAWLQLLSPATAALNVKKRHIPVMTSFINSPLMHVAACKNPKMMGGPFVNYGPDSVPQISTLLENTESAQQQLLALADGLEQLNLLLAEEADGYVLTALYEKIPEVIKGYVELEYDLYGNPGFRLLESMLYKSPYYDKTVQSVSLRSSSEDVRPFMLSSPRLAPADEMSVNLPFDAQAYDRLFRSRTEPVDFQQICQALNVDEETALKFFTSQAPESTKPLPEGPDGTFRVRYFGHACLLIESAGVNILIDPVLAYQTGKAPERYTFYDLPEVIDYVLISHHHQDHLQIETLLQLRHKVKQVVVGANLKGALQDPSIKLMLKAMGFTQVVELDELEDIAFDGGKITALPFLGEHHDLAIRSRLGYRIDIGTHSVTTVVDSCNIAPEVYHKVFEALGPTDMLFLGMECVGSPLSWSYGALLPAAVERGKDRSRRGRASNFEEAKSLVNILQPAGLYVYAMALEPWLQHILGLAIGEDAVQMIESGKVVDWCLEQGLSAQRLYGKADFLLQHDVMKKV